MPLFCAYFRRMQINTETALANLGIETLKPMQEAALSAIANNNATVLIAPTGSGKTIAFLLPLLKLLKPEVQTVQCMVLVPSRELALQIEQVWKKMGTSFKVNVCYGGHSSQTEIKNLSTPPALLIGTPGRVADHMRRNSFSTEGVKTLILDEFDKSLELGFQEDMGAIISSLTKLNKRILVSATDALQIPAFAGIVSPKVLDFSQTGETDSGLTLKLVIADDKEKFSTLFQLLCSLDSEPALMFCNHRDVCEDTVEYLNSKGIFATFYHGGMEQDDRERALIQFRNGSVNYLVTTDLAARGLDIPEMKNVIHFQLPAHENEFTHRNGRTARMQATGTAYLVLSKFDRHPDYISEDLEEVHFQKKNKLPEPPQFQTLYISGGKKNKLNKMDIVGCFLQKGKLEKDDLGLIEVKDYFSYVAIKKNKSGLLLNNIKDEKIKGKKYKIGIAKLQSSKD